MIQIIRLRNLQLGLLLLSFLPSVTLAEGAVRILDCYATLLCNASGDCEPLMQPVSFQFEPVLTDSEGAGDYLLTYSDNSSEMMALSLAGPFYWLEGETRNTLIASSEIDFLWHRLTLEPTPDSVIRYLTCQFLQ